MVKPTHRKHLAYHDYRERCIYHITLVCSERKKLLGRVVGDSVDEARCELTPLGVEVAKAIQGIPGCAAVRGDNVQVLAAVCMPEHVHFVLYVRERMKDKVGVVIRGFKQGCNKALKRWLEMSEAKYGNGGGNGGVVGELEKFETPNGKTNEERVAGEMRGARAEDRRAGEMRGVCAEDGRSGEMCGVRAEDGRSGEMRGVRAEDGRAGEMRGVCAEDGRAGEMRGVCAEDGRVGEMRWVRAGDGRDGEMCGVCAEDGRSGEMRGVHAEDGRDGEMCGVRAEDGRDAKDAKDGGRYGDVGGWGPFSPSRIDAFLRQLMLLSSARIKSQHALFEPDFDETRLRRKGQLRAMIDYVHNNPVHRWQKQRNPGWLVPIRGIMIAGRSYDGIGNVNLLGLSRWQVHVRRAWDDDARRRYMNECVVKARNGSALVSPFISQHEAAVRDFCLSEGHSVIVLVDNGFAEYAQCPGGLYDYCVNGQVLVLAASELGHEDRKGAISREECVWLNGLAEEICGEVVS